MPTSSLDKELVSYVIDLMQPIGPVYAKRMFGGHGIFLDGLMFGLIADSVLYLKADAETVNEFTDRDLEAFTYNKKGKQFKMRYYQAPDEALEVSEVMSLWANDAYSVALRAASEKHKKSD
jgi:DNA transformation protein